MQKRGGTITIHSLELCEELLGTNLGESKPQKTVQDELPTISTSPQRHAPSSPTRVPSRSSTAQMTRIEDWLSRKARRAVVSLPDDPELTKIQDLCQTITDREREFLSELDTFLATQEERHRCKKEVLYRKWCERVFDPVQDKLSSQMTSQGYHSLDKTKRELFGQYLNYRNKQQVFLDTISPEDYDPMEQGRALKVSTGPLDDPLISQRTEFVNEQLVLRGCDQGIPPHDVIPPPCDGREDTDCALWLAMQLVHIDSEARKRSRNRMLGIRNDSSVDSGTLREASQEVVKKELNIPHRRPIHYPREQFVLKWDNPPQKISTPPT